MMMKHLSRFLFSTPKEQYSRFFILRFSFPQDGFYESNQHRPAFIDQFHSLQKTNEAILLGGDSFPFGCTTLFLNCDSEQTASSFAHKNVYVEKGLAGCEVSEIERLSSAKLGNIASFYEMKMDL